METKETIVIGAGISGLLCAQALKDAGVQVIVLEKSSEVGGRMATLHFEGGNIDIGTQLFTSRDLRFQMIVDEWLREDICKRWFVSEGNELGAQGYVRYCGCNGMSDAPKWIAQTLDVRTDTTIQKCTYSHSEGLWTLWQAGHPAFQCETLILTAPLPQSLALLEAGHASLDIAIHDELKGIHYQRGLTLIAALDGPANVSEHGGLRIGKPPLSWIGDNQAKGISDRLCAVTIHTTPNFTEEHWNSSEKEQADLILNAAKPYLSAKVTQWKCYKWNHSFPINPWHNLFYQDLDRSLFLAGDAFGGPRVEGAALSGLMAAAEYIELRGKTGPA